MSNDPQLKLTAIEEDLRASGVEETPEGLGTLTRKEVKFVTALLRHGQMAQAAKEAGYSAESAGQIASETLRKPKVFRFYKKCLAQLAKNGDEVVRRVMERSTLLHAKATECAQQAANLEKLLLLSYKDEDGCKGSKQINEYETQLSRTVKLEKHYMTLANQTDTLLASLLGKLSLSVSGEIKHSGELTLAPGTLDVLATMRREVTAASLQGGRN